jgi:hypothetical protein
MRSGRFGGNGERLDDFADVQPIEPLHHAGVEEKCQRHTSARS